MLLYGLTIFFGAFLLFLVQPLIGKYLLPWFGGGPGVWTVCLLFFQAVLLGGYAYAHVSTMRLRPRAQAGLHGVLLALSLACLPIIPNAAWKPVDGEEPTLRILLLLTATIGLPYFVLSATGPLLQRWFTLTQPGAFPYRLYALSNVGSLLALLGYPFVLEPLWSRPTQAWVWSGGMLVFAGLGAMCAWRVWRANGEPARPESAPSPAAEKVSVGRMAWWLALPAVASVLLVAITNKLTLEVAPVPFLWVLPLAVYLVSFILCFDHPRWYARGVFAALLAVGCGAVGYLLHAGTAVPMKVQVAVYPAVLFVACMVCHGEVYRLRPGAAQLTRFYLCLAAGGAAGSLFVAVIAPRFFHDYYELQIGLCVAVSLLGLLGFERSDRRFPRATAVTWLMVAAGMAVGFFMIARRGRENVVAESRNFYGALQVQDLFVAQPLERHRALRHGVTTHGAQFHAAERAQWPTTYFGPSSGVGMALNSLKVGPRRHVGLVGLGAGTLASYGRSGDRFTFYEIDPAVIQIARSPFTFLKSSAAQIEVVPGDARLTLESQARRGDAQHFDVLVLDAFNSDAIPVHLLTAEAMEIYLAHLKPDGLIAVHLSNRYVDLRGVVVGLAQRFDMDFVIVDDNPRTENYWVGASRWCWLAKNKDLLRQWMPPSPEARKALEAQYHPVLWTDDHASLLSVWQ